MKLVKPIIVAFVRDNPGTTSGAVGRHIQSNNFEHCSHLTELISRGQLFRVGTDKQWRYFATQEAADAARSELMAAIAAESEAKRVARHRRRSAKRKAERHARGLKIVKKAEPKPRKSRAKAKNVPRKIPKALRVMPEKTPRLSGPTGPVIVPAHVKVQVYPTRLRWWEIPDAGERVITNDYMQRRQRERQTD
jgi:hypothetical protein